MKNMKAETDLYCPECVTKIYNEGDEMMKITPFTGNEECCRYCDTMLRRRSPGGQSDSWTFIVQGKSDPVAVIKDYNRKTGDKTLAVIREDEVDDVLVIHADLDKLGEIRIITQDARVCLLFWRGEPDSPDDHETYVSVQSNLFPKGFPDSPSRYRLRLIGFDPQRGEGASVIAFGTRDRKFNLNKLVEDQDP